MFGFLKSLLPEAEQAQLKLEADLAAYVESLVGGSRRKMRVEAYLAESGRDDDRREPATYGLEALPTDAQIYIASFLMHAIMALGVTEPDEASEIMDYVLRTGAECDEGHAFAIAGLGLRLCVMLNLDPEHDDESTRGLRAHQEIAAAAAADAKDYAALPEDLRAAASYEEVDRFFKAYVQEDESKKQLRRLSEYLLHYAQTQSMTAYLAPKIDAAVEAMEESGEVDPGSLYGDGYVGWNRYAQLFLLSVAGEACRALQIADDEQIGRLSAWLLGQIGGDPDRDFSEMVTVAELLRQAAASPEEQKHLREEVINLLPCVRQGLEAGKALARRFTAGVAEIPETERLAFAEHFGGAS